VGGCGLFCPVWICLSCLVLSSLVLSCLVLSCPVWSRLVLSCFVLSCPVLSCLVWSGLVWSCLVLACLVVSCLALSRRVSYCLVLSWRLVVCLVLALPSFSPRHNVFFFLFLATKGTGGQRGGRGEGEGGSGKNDAHVSRRAREIASNAPSRVPPWKLAPDRGRGLPLGLLRAHRSAGVAAPAWASTTPGWLKIASSP